MLLSNQGAPPLQLAGCRRSFCKETRTRKGWTCLNLWRPSSAWVFHSQIPPQTSRSFRGILAKLMKTFLCHLCFPGAKIQGSQTGSNGSLRLRRGVATSKKLHRLWQFDRSWVPKMTQMYGFLHLHHQTKVL